MKRGAEGKFAILVRRALGLTLVYMTALIAVSAFRPTVAVGGDLDALQDRITYFYRNPDLGSVPDILRGLDEEGLLAGRGNIFFPTGAFLAPLFERHPERIDALIAGPFSRNVQTVIGVGLALAGMTEKAVEYARRNGWPAEKIDAVKQAYGNLLEARISEGRELDMLWSASFATGDKRYPARIIDVIAENLASGKFQAQDIAYLGDPVNLRKSDNAELARIAGRYKDQDLEELMMNGSAIWSLGSNAKQHAFVMEAVQERIAAAPDSDLAYLLRKTVFRATTAPLCRIEGKALKGVVGLTPQEKFGGEGKSFEAAVDTFKSSARIEFAAGQPAFIAVLAQPPAGEALEFSFEITSPSGRAVDVGPFQWRTEGSGGRAMLSAMQVLPSDLKEEGVYTVKGAFWAKGGDAVTTENRFFVGSR